MKIRAVQSWREQNGVVPRKRDRFVQGDDVMGPCRRDPAVPEGSKACVVWKWVWSVYCYHPLVLRRCLGGGSVGKGRFLAGCTSSDATRTRFCSSWNRR